MTRGIRIINQGIPGSLGFEFRVSRKDWRIELQILDMNTWTWTAGTQDHETTCQWIVQQLSDLVITPRGVITRTTAPRRRVV